MTNVNAIVLLHLPAVHKEKSGTINLANANVYLIFLVVQIPNYGMMTNANANVLLQLQAVLKAKSGTINLAIANVLTSHYIV